MFANKPTSLSTSAIVVGMCLGVLTLIVATSCVVRDTPATDVVTGVGDHSLQKPELVGDLIKEGKRLYEMGRLDAAAAKLQQALKVEPDNKAAQYYLRLVLEARQAGSVHPPLMPVPRGPDKT